jgi:two-component system response regulator VicR
MRDVWHYEYYGDLRVVDVCVRRLREKIEQNPAFPEIVMTKRGKGYCFANPADAKVLTTEALTINR